MNCRSSGFFGVAREECTTGEGELQGGRRDEAHRAQTPQL